MKINEFLFEHFAPVSSKEWKQKIQYELNGADYQKTLIKPIAQGVTSLPFYTNTDLDKLIDFDFNTSSKKSVLIEVKNVEEANKEALLFIEFGVKHIYFICYSKEINAEQLVSNITIPITINCQFIDVKFAKSIQTKDNVNLLFDPLGKLSKTGSWYRNQDYDFKKLNSVLNYSNTSININLSLFYNAGADVVQQISYALLQVIDYCKNVAITDNLNFSYSISVSTDIYTEIAKLKALRILHFYISKQLGCAVNCEISLVKGLRNIKATDHKYNTMALQVEQLIGFASHANYVCSNPISNYFLENDLENKNKEDISFLKYDFVEQSSIFSDSVYIENLTQQIVNSALKLIENIESGNGYLIQFKKGIIQQKIFENALKEQKEYSRKFKNTVTPQFIRGKKSIKYPFFKHNEKQTQYKTIVEKRLHAPLEKALWDEFVIHE